MGLDGAACLEVQRRLGALVEQEGRKAVLETLDVYMDEAPDLEDWEITGIVEFAGAQELVNEQG
jgi:hypothetical protein